MEKACIQLLILFFVILTNGSCKKNDQPPKIEIEETDLTDCPDDNTCKYFFYENADAGSTLKAGPYRLFQVIFERPGITTSFNIKGPMEGDKFLLNKQDVLGGRVQMYTTCITCSMAAGYKVLDGYVKGINLTPDKPFNESKWLLQIEIISGVEGSSMKGATYIKQYFYPKAN